MKRKPYRLELDMLETRTVPALTAGLSAGVLNVVGTAADEDIELIRQADGTIEVRDAVGTVAVTGGPATTTNTDTITIDPAGGHDNVFIDLAAGPLAHPGDDSDEIKVNLINTGFSTHLFFGGQDAAGDHIAIGQTTVDFDSVYNLDVNNDGDVDVTGPSLRKISLFGKGGDDTIDASGNATVGSAVGSFFVLDLNGGDGDDALIGGDSDDHFFPGIGDNTVTGGAGFDYFYEERNLDFALTDGLLVVTDPANGNAQVLSDTFNDTIESMVLVGGAGDNLIDASAYTNGGVVLDGLAGNDTLKGGAGYDVLFGYDGADFLSGGGGLDALLGENDGDTFSPDDDPAERLDFKKKKKDTVAVAPFSPRGLGPWQDLGDDARSSFRGSSMAGSNPPYGQGNVFGPEIPHVGKDWTPQYQYTSPFKFDGTNPQGVIDWGDGSKPEDFKPKTKKKNQSPPDTYFQKLPKHKYNGPGFKTVTITIRERYDGTPFVTLHIVQLVNVAP